MIATRVVSPSPQAVSQPPPPGDFGAEQGQRSQSGESASFVLVAIDIGLRQLEIDRAGWETGRVGAAIRIRLPAEEKDMHQTGHLWFDRFPHRDRGIVDDRGGGIKRIARHIREHGRCKDLELERAGSGRRGLYRKNAGRDLADGSEGDRRAARIAEIIGGDRRFIDVLVEGDRVGDRRGDGGGTTPDVIHDALRCQSRRDRIGRAMQPGHDNRADRLVVNVKLVDLAPE